MMRKLLLSSLCSGGLSTRQQQVVGNLQRIRAVVKHHVRQVDETRTGQFLSAAASGQVDRVKLLLQQGYNPNTADYDKRTALMLAAANGHKVSGFGSPVGVGRSCAVLIMASCS